MILRVSYAESLWFQNRITGLMGLNQTHS